MKNTFTLLLFMLFSVASFAQLDEEGFEGTWTTQAGIGAGGPADWAIANIFGPVQTWSHGNGGAATPVYAGDYSATILGENVTNGSTSEDWLITKAFTVPANAELHFFSRLGVNNDQGTTYKIMMSANTGAGQQTVTTNFAAIQNWTELQLNPTQQEWIEKVVNIPATFPAGTQVYLAFVMQGDAGDRWAIDNVKVVSKCLNPTTLAAVPSNTSAALSWANPSGATAWEIEVVTGSPTGVGVEYSGALPYNAPGLTASTTYKYYVRALCDDNTSDWVGPFTFTTTVCPIEQTCNYVFNVTDSWGDGWNGNTMTVSQNGVTMGTLALPSGTGPVAITVPLCDGQPFQLFWNSGGSFPEEVGVSITNNFAQVLYTKASGTGSQNSVLYTNAALDCDTPACLPVTGLTTSNVTAYAANLSWGGSNTGNWEYYVVPTGAPAPTAATSGTATTTKPVTVNTIAAGTALTPATAYQFYVRVVCGGGAFSAWSAVGSFTTQPTCPQPTALNTTLLGDDEVTLNWTEAGTATAWEVYVVPVASAAPTAATTGVSATTTSLPYNTALVPNTSYKFYVRAICSATDKSVWSGPINFTTSQIPAILNYTQNFDGAAVTDWALNNGTATNKWVVGSATSNSPSKSLYISNDNGTSNAYNISANSVVQAYRDVFIPADASQVSLSFDWKNQGESNWDYIRVWITPVSFTPVVNTQTTTQSGGIQLGGNFQLNSSWTTFNGIIDVSAYAGQTRRVIFEWRNDTSGGTQPPGAIDNINMSVVTCPQPTVLTAGIVTATSANLGWTNQGTANQWEVYVVANGAAAPTATTTGTLSDVNPYIPTTLTPATAYQFYVRAICSATDKSFWSGPFAFTTAIANDDCSGAVSLPVNPGEDCVQSVLTSFTGATASPQPICTGVNGADIWYTFTAAGPKHNISADFSNLSTSQLENSSQPITLSLYGGNVCTALDTPLYCVTNNYILASNLTPGATYTVRVTINNATPNLNYPFNMCVTTPETGSGTASACEITTINYSFESPDLPSTQFYPPNVNQNVVPGWKTTASDAKIEVWRASTTANPFFEVVEAYEGEQFIELNANEPSALYQDYVSPPGTVFTYSFGHRGRAGTDVCQVKAGPPGGPYTNVGPPVSTGNTAWSTNTGSYTVPAGQTVTRFLFESVSTAATGPTGPSTGNFLDAVVFTANVGIVTVSPVALDCENNVATIQANGTGTWVAHSGNPAPTVIADDQSNTTTVSGFTTPGSYYYEWTTALCSGTLEIDYQGGVIAMPTVSDVVYCQNDTPAQLTATASGTNTLHWFADATGGTELTTAPTPTTTTVGTTTYYVSQTLFNCESPRAAITVTVNALPAAPAVTDVEYCQNATAVALTATPATGNTLNWYTVANGGTPLAAAPVPVTTTVGTTIYYVSQQTALGCESDRAQIVVTINPLITPVSAFTLPATVCAVQSIVIPVPGTGFTTGGTYTAGTGLDIDPVTGAIDIAGSTAGTYTVTYTIAPDATTCNVGSSSQATITITPATAPDVTFSYVNVCNTAANQLPVTSAGFATGGTFTAGAGLSINAATGEINVANSTAGTYTVTYTVAENAPACIAAATGTATIVITAAVVPVTEFNYDNAYCFGSANAIPSFAGGFSAGGTFTATGGLNINPATGEVNIGTGTAGVYTVTYTVAANPANCELGGSYTDTFAIGAEIDFTLNGDCEGSEYFIRATATNGEFADGLVFEWGTTTGATVGGNNDYFNVTEYVKTTTVEETFPLQFVLTVYDGDCQSSVVFDIQDITCMIQRGVSPDGDGKNDNFELTTMGVDKLVIFNRYGQEVYSKTNYTNEWFGQTDKGDHLPTGTYYYMIKRNNGETRTGWIYVNWPN